MLAYGEDVRSAVSTKEADTEVGLVYFGERYLVPGIGRWATPDPLAIHAVGGGESLNSYHYVSGNLLQARDPWGLAEWGKGDASGDGATVHKDAPESVDPGHVYMERADGKVFEAPTDCSGSACQQLYAQMQQFLNDARASGQHVNAYLPGLNTPGNGGGRAPGGAGSVGGQGEFAGGDASGAGDGPSLGGGEGTGPGHPEGLCEDGCLDGLVGEVMNAIETIKDGADAAGTAIAAAGKKGLTRALQAITDDKPVPDAPTSRAARRKAMRESGTPTSRPAVSQSGTGGRRQYVVEGADGKPRVQTQHPPDKKHPLPHWHDAKPKVDPATGRARMSNHEQVKYEKNGSTTATYPVSE